VHVLDAGAHGVDVLHVAGDDVAREHVAQRRVFPAGDDDREVLLAGGEHPGVLRVDLVGLLELTAAQNLVHELVREIALAGLVGLHPFLEHDVLDAAHGLHLGDAGVGDAVHVAGEQRLLVGGGEVAVAGDALVVVVRDEVEDVLFEIGAGADDAVDLVLADHLGEGDAELGGGHGATEGDEHLAAGLQVGLVALGGVEQGGSIEVMVVLRDELRDGALLGREGGVDVFRAFGAAFGFHGRNGARP